VRAALVLALVTPWSLCAHRDATAQGDSRLDVSTPLTYFIAPASAESGATEADRTLARWALESWARLVDPPLALAAGPEEGAAVRVYWVGPADGLYGEMRGRVVDGRPAADVFVHPRTEGLGADIDAVATRDPLFRDTIVYLTCVHELGHAFGLRHTSAFADIMYSFQFGGDFVAYFMRFREQLERREDIPGARPFSEGDTRAFRSLYAEPGPDR
jgi:hypothetical protein